MRSSSVAEWMVSRFIERNRAASIVGDLVELKPQKGTLWFWFSILGVMLSITWRYLAALTAAFVAEYCAAMVSNIVGFRLPYAFPHTHLVSLLEPVFFMLVIVHLLGWMALFYAVICYGFSDELTQFTFVVTVIATAACYGWGQLIVLTLCIILTVCTIAACIAWAKWRRAALTLFVSMLAGFVCFSLSGFPVSWYHGYVFHRGMGHREIRAAYYSFLGVVYLTSFISTYVAAMVCSRMHRGMVGANGPQPAE